MPEDALTDPLPPTDLDHVVVIGASLAGLRACETLRAEGFAGRISLVGAEPHTPYDRPPLSKLYLAGELAHERIALRKPDDIASLGLDLRTGVEATSLDTGARRVTLVDRAAGDEYVLGYDGLIIATGSAPRRLPGQPEARGIHMLRSLDESNRLRDELTVEPRPRLVVIGAGFIGLEVAATARMLGCEVVVLEGASAPLIRGLGAEMGTAVAAVHADHGVPVRCGVMVLGFATDEATGAVRGVRIARPDGGGEELVAADVVLVGVGVAPVTEWLHGSGLELRDGIVCDATLWTGAHRVFAAGDCARWVNELYDEEMRVEHWTNASEQGAAAARNLLAVSSGGQPVPYAPVPFFWSDQYDSRVQFLGRAGSGMAEEAALDIEVLHGSLASRKFVALYGRHGRFRGVLGVSMPRVVMPYRRLLAQAASWDDALAHAASVG